MALKVVIEGIQEFYNRAKEEEKEEGTLHSKEFRTKLLPRVKVLRLTSQTIKRHTAEQMRLESIPSEDDCMAMFDEEDTYPFLGFGRYGEPTVQLPTVTRSLKKELDTPMEDSETQRTSLNKDKTKKKVVRGKKRNRSIAIKRRAAVTVQPKIASVRVQPKIASVTVQPKIASVTVQPKIAFVTVQPKIASVTVQPKIASVTVQPKIAAVTVQPKIASSNKASPDADNILGDPEDLPEARNHLTEDIFSSFSTSDIHELQLSIKDEIDDDDITIETEDFDYSYNVNERLLSPSSDRLRHAAPENHNMSHLNNNCGLPSENLNDFVFREHSGQKTNGLSRPNNLTELTTLLLELNNKNNTLEKKLAILKKAYETKTAKILQEKKTNENKIQVTLQKIQSWRDDPESSCVESRLSSPARSNTGTCHPGGLVFPVLRDPGHVQTPLNFVPQVHQGYSPGCGMLQSPPRMPSSPPGYYHCGVEEKRLLQEKQLQQEKRLQQESKGRGHLEEGDTVRMKHANGRKKWKKATIISPWSYLVRDYKGQVYRKSFKQLVRTQQKPYLIPVRNHVLSGDGVDDDSPKSGRGRVIKRRERLDL